jgi:hypothetical protein
MILEKPSNLDYIFAITPVPIIGERKAKEVAIFETMKDSIYHPEMPKFVEWYTHATMVKYRLYAYCTTLVCLSVVHITSVALDKYFESILQ